MFLLITGMDGWDGMYSAHYATERETRDVLPARKTSAGIQNDQRLPYNNVDQGSGGFSRARKREIVLLPARTTIASMQNDQIFQDFCPNILQVRVIGKV